MKDNEINDLDDYEVKEMMRGLVLQNIKDSKCYFILDCNDFEILCRDLDMQLVIIPMQTLMFYKETPLDETNFLPHMPDLDNELSTKWWQCTMPVEDEEDRGIPLAIGEGKGGYKETPAAAEMLKAGHVMESGVAEALETALTALPKKEGTNE